MDVFKGEIAENGCNMSQRGIKMGAILLLSNVIISGGEKFTIHNFFWDTLYIETRAFGFTPAKGGARNFVLENRPEQPSGSDYDSRQIFYTEPNSDLTGNTVSQFNALFLSISMNVKHVKMS